MHPIRVLLGHEDGLTHASISPDGRRALTTSRDRSWRVWDLATGQLVRNESRGVPVVAAAFLGEAIVSAARDYTLTITDLKAGSIHLTLFRESVRDLAVTPDLSAIVVAYRDGRCSIIGRSKASGGWDTREIAVAPAPINQICGVGQDNSFLSCCEDGSLHMFTLSGREFRSGSVLHFQLCDFPISSAAPLPDRKHIVAACADGRLRLARLSYDPASESAQAKVTVVRELAVGTDQPTAVAVTPDGKRAIWGSASGNVSSWPVDTTAREALPQGADRLKLAYLAVLELPELWRVLETFDEAALAALRTQLSVPAEMDVLAFLESRHPGAQPPTLWSSWMETLQSSKLKSAAGTA
jgi:WD40 repeat protein